MLKQIRLLVKLQICNLFGLNEFRYTKDTHKKHRYIGMAAIWALLSVILVVYIALFSDGLIRIGLGEVVPEYLFTVTSLLILFFTFFKAGSVIFQMRTYESLISLPVSKTAIVVSRFLCMYITNLLMSCFIMVPGVVLYGIWVHPSISFYIFSLLGVLFLPLLPITLATIIGAFITAVSSRMKRKSLVNSLLSLLLLIGFMVVSTGSARNADNFNGEMFKNLSSVVSDQIQRLYPPAVWFGRSAIAGNLGSFLLFFSVSAALFLLMVVTVAHYFTGICTALNATSAKNNYKMRALHTNSPLMAMFHRELKRYFASSIYVTNTIIGYILMAVASIALFVTGPEKLEAAFQAPGMISKLFPLLLAAIGSLTSPTSCSISMEGKQWWIAKTIPVGSKDIFNSKILTTLAVAAPEYIIAVVFGLLAVHPSFLGALWIIVIPAVYIVFMAVVGITVNLRIPVFNWENEMRAVKQSASVMVTMLIGFISYLLPIACTLVLRNISADLILLITFLTIAGITAVLYLRKDKKELLYIG